MEADFTSHMFVLFVMSHSAQAMLMINLPQKWWGKFWLTRNWFFVCGAKLGRESITIIQEITSEYRSFQSVESQVLQDVYGFKLSVLISQVNPVLFAAVSLEVFRNSWPVLAGTQFLRLRLEAWFLVFCKKKCLSLPPPSPHPLPHFTYNCNKVMVTEFYKMQFWTFFL